MNTQNTLVEVHKFGGGCLDSAKAIKQMTEIVKKLSKKKIFLVIVFSAFGKMTNWLTLYAEAVRDGRKEECKEIFARIRQYHEHILYDLFPNENARDKNNRIFV